MKEIQKDDSTIRRLTYVKGLFRIGAEHFEAKTSVNIAQAVLTFDNSIEMVLRLTADTLGIRFGERRDIYFHDLLVKVNEYLKSTTAIREDDKESQPFSLPEQSLIELHRARNGIQHSGIIPDVSIAERYKTITETTLSILAKYVFSMEWAQISVGLLVKNNVLRELYSLAEAEYEKCNYTEAAFALLATFELGKLFEQSRIWGSGISWKRETIAKDTHSPKSIIEYTKAIEDEVEILKLGLDYKSYMRYKEISPSIIGPFKHPFGSKHIGELQEASEVLSIVKQELGDKLVYDQHDTKLQEWVMFALTFVVENLLHWEMVSRPSYLELFNFSGLLESLTKAPESEKK